jgi:hypothetical protein
MRGRDLRLCIQWAVESGFTFSPAGKESSLFSFERLEAEDAHPRIASRAWPAQVTDADQGL